MIASQRVSGSATSPHRLKPLSSLLVVHLSLSTPAKVCDLTFMSRLESEHILLTSLNTEFKNKKVVLVSIPGAFTPTCSGSHIPSYLEHVDKIKAKGVDQVIVIAVNDPFVMSGWAKANGITDDKIVSSL